MKKSYNGILRVLFAIIISTMVFGFFIQAAAAEPVEQQLLVDKARITFENFMTDKDHLWLRENLNQAKGLIIIPSLLKAGFLSMKTIPNRLPTMMASVFTMVPSKFNPPKNISQQLFEI